MPAVNAAPSPTKKQHFLRNLEAWAYLEAFLVSSVAAILGIRLFLQLTGYPQLGGRGLHIAHMLWGGLLMLAAMIILLAFLSKTAHRVAAVVGGLGFGTFIDEIGKFVTADNNYFFQPAVALIYVTFILIYLAIHTIHGWEYTQHEYLLNALREMEEVVLQDLTEKERTRVLLYLSHSNPDHPLVPALRQQALEAELVPISNPSLYARLRSWLTEFYRKMALLPGFSIAVTVFFLAQLLISLVYAFVIVFFFGLRWERIFDVDILAYVATRVETFSFLDGARLFASFLGSVFILLGVARLWKSRLAAFEMFERAVLVSIFLTRVFSFYRQEFLALSGLLFDILLLLAVRFVIDQERLDAAQKPSFV